MEQAGMVTRAADPPDAVTSSAASPSASVYLLLVIPLLLITGGSFLSSTNTRFGSTHSASLSTDNAPASICATPVSVDTPEPVPATKGTVLTVRQNALLGRPLDINAATWEEVTQLPGISDAVAKAVVERREKVGRFATVDDLLTVRGIKEKRLSKIRPFIAIPSTAP